MRFSNFTLRLYSFDVDGDPCYSCRDCKMRLDAQAGNAIDLSEG